MKFFFFFLFRIVSVLKNGQLESNDSDYNALQMLRQHNMKSKDKSEIQNNDDDVENDKKDNESYKEKDVSDDEDDESKLENSTKNTIQVDNSEQDNSDNSESHKRQTILLSATLTHAVEKLAGLTMNDPVIVDAAKDNIEAAGGNFSEINEDFVVPQSVTQTYMVTPPKLRMVTLSAYIVSKCQVCHNICM